MTNWRRRSLVHEFIRTSPWFAPAVSIVVALVAARLLRNLDARLRWAIFGFSADGARAILGVFIASTLTFVVLVASTLLLVVQLASAALTPRIIMPVFRDPRIRIALSLFLFSYAISIALIGRIEDNVPQLALAIAIVTNVLSVVFFLYFVIAMGMALRPAYVLTRLAESGRKVIFHVYPLEHGAAEPNGEVDWSPPATAHPTLVPHRGPSGVLLAFDAKGMIDFATKNGAVIEMIPHVGDFIPHGEPIFKISSDVEVDGRPLRKMIATGAERTLEQDATLAFRNIIDIANKALSPAINDPTTAVLAIDQVQRLLRTVGGRKLHSGRQTDASGKVRLLFPTPKWEQFVTIACEELRIYGATTPRILQRLRLMIVKLGETLPESRRPALREELRLLDETAATLATKSPPETPARLVWD